MRDFNKVHVIALPRCATVSMMDALGELGIRVAHLGKIYGEETPEHNDPVRLMRMYEQIRYHDYKLDILGQCDGLADYPACIAEVFEALDQQYPGSLFINVRRDRDVHAWLQSVERQFIGLALLKTGRDATPESRRFMEVMTEFRRMTFGQIQFDPDRYLRAYEEHQREITRYFARREGVLLDIPDIRLLPEHGFDMLCNFLECPVPNVPFPRANDHSEAPRRAYLEALARGEIESKTGIVPADKVASSR